MLRLFRMLVVVLVAMGSASVASAQGFDQRRLFFGAGLSANSVDGADNHATGFQFFGGYNFGEFAPKFHIDAELGYMDSAKGLWATGVARYMVTPQFELIARLGYDFGDDDGLMAGIGAGYVVNPHLKLRAEYVVRDNIDSIQFNLVFYPW
jgi:Outer membrane protein beta-barrel domain